ncbi:heme NO-binding domain-containing protein [Frigidibacter sp. MR17.14]|uniref:heme NO-binding domain-containing protein n=1 Tax=Frigidibacter sp. MR17.14 TaxID=3126509 RepID=UPI0030131B7E
MHGLVNRALQCFLRDTYPPQVWRDLASELGIGRDGFEAMLDYPEPLARRFLALAADRLGKPDLVLLEDLGAYLVGREAIRRLLRFGGSSYPDFLLSLEDLPDRVALALPELRLPALAVRAVAGGHYRVTVAPAADGTLPPELVTPVLAGLLRAMADDYGALVFLDFATLADGGAEIALVLLEDRYAPGRGFRLAATVA